MSDQASRSLESLRPTAERFDEDERIYAVIWLCDLRDSTRLCDGMPVESFVRLLNDFFDCTAGAALDHGGRILTYIGDAALAIFPIGQHDRPLKEVCTAEEGACSAALAAAREARERLASLNEQRHARDERTLQFALALHVGDVVYGHIGVRQRHHLTVIGSAVNEAARLTALCKDLDCSILISSAFPSCFPDQLVSLGRHRLRGVEGEQEVFTLAN